MTPFAACDGHVQGEVRSPEWQGVSYGRLPIKVTPGHGLVLHLLLTRKRPNSSHNAPPVDIGHEGPSQGRQMQNPRSLAYPPSEAVRSDSGSTSIEKDTVSSCGLHGNNLSRMVTSFPASPTMRKAVMRLRLEARSCTSNQ